MAVIHHITAFNVDVYKKLRCALIRLQQVSPCFATCESRYSRVESPDHFKFFTRALVSHHDL